MRHLRTITLLTAALAMSTVAIAQSKNKGKAAKASEPVAAATLPEADTEQLTAMAMTLFGNYDCEYDQKLVVAKHPTREGYVDVMHGKHTFTMKPVRSQTGALRLEEVSGAMLMVQIPSKSMLMDTKLGKRVVDACKSDEQRKEVESADSLGISAPGQMALPDVSAAQPKR
jgi:hypothetical protein